MGESRSQTARTGNWAEARGRWDVGSGLKNQEQLDEFLAFLHARKARTYGFQYVPVRFYTDHVAATIETFCLRRWQEIPIARSSPS